MSNPSTGPPPPPPPPPFRPVADFISRWPPSSGGRFLPFALPASVNQRFSTPATRRWPRHSHQRAAAQDDRRKLKKKQSKTRKEIYKKNSIKIIQRPRALIAFTPCFSDTNGVIKKKTSRNGRIVENEERINEKHQSTRTRHRLSLRSEPI